MANRDIVVIGGSAGAIGVLMHLVDGLPAELAASIFVVVQFPEAAAADLPRLPRRVDGEGRVGLAQRSRRQGQLSVADRFSAG